MTVVPFSAAWDHTHDGTCAGNVLARVDFEQPFSLKVRDLGNLKVMCEFDVC